MVCEQYHSTHTCVTVIDMLHYNTTPAEQMNIRRWCFPQGQVH